MARTRSVALFLLLCALGLQLFMSVLAAVSCSRGSNPWGAMIVIYSLNWPSSVVVHSVVGWVRSGLGVELAEREPWIATVVGCAFNGGVLALIARSRRLSRSPPDGDPPAGRMRR